jgi:hypothetical protein
VAKAEHDEDAGELAEIGRDVRFHGEGLEIDDTQQELAVKDAELKGQSRCAALDKREDEVTHG